MSKEMTDEKQELVPRLRFPEFSSAEVWQKKPLGQLGEFIGGGTPSKNEPEFWQGSMPWISSSDIYEDTIHKISITRFITEEALKKSATKLVPKLSILLVSRVGVGKLAVSKKKLCTSQDFTNFIPYETDVFFLAYYLKANTRLLDNFCQGMAIKGFTKEDISKLELAIPDSATEQQKRPAAKTIPPRRRNRATAAVCGVSGGW